MNKVILLFICSFAWVACKNQVKQEEAAIAPTTVVTEGEIRQLPDPDFHLEGVDVELLQKTIVNHLQVKENHLQFALTKEEFVNRGLPAAYYDRLLESLDEANQMVDSTGLENVDQIVKDSYKDLYDLFGDPETEK